MNIETTLHNLRALKLTGMANALTRQQEQPMLHLDLSFDERFALLVEHEVTHRRSRAQQKRLQQARFKLDAPIEQLDGNAARGVNRAQLAELAQGNWITAHHNMLITGATGSG
jgi:DNA replication protein DnaC